MSSDFRTNTGVTMHLAAAPHHPTPCRFSIISLCIVGLCAAFARKAGSPVHPDAAGNARTL